MENIRMLMEVAKALGELREKVVFVGGATVSLYATDPAATDIRPTDDIDCITENASRRQFYEMEEILRAKGFVNDQTVICRWNYYGVTVDIMPANPEILGFSNQWYPAGIQTAIDINLPDKQQIKILSAPYFIATKFEAFTSRGKREMRWSSDFEDIIYVLDNRNEIEQELMVLQGKVKDYIKKEFKTLLADMRN